MYECVCMFVYLTYILVHGMNDVATFTQLGQQGAIKTRARNFHTHTLLHTSITYAVLSRMPAHTYVTCVYKRHNGLNQSLLFSYSPWCHHGRQPWK